MSEKLWYKVARNFIKAGRLPIRVSDTIIDIMQALLTEEQAKFITLLKKRSYNIDQIKSLTDLDEESLNDMLNDLMNIGVISGIPSRSTGVMVYRKTPLLPGIIEFTLMRGETNEKAKYLAKLYSKFYNQIVQDTQNNYSQMVQEFKDGPSIDRVIPVEEEVKVREEIVLPLEEVSKIIEKYDPIGVTVCYCRHKKDLLDESCETTKERRNCFAFGRTAEFLISHGFVEKISKEESMQIMKKAEDEGLVHKAFHTNLDIEKELNGICNCCKCCCGTFLLHYTGGIPLMDLTSHLAHIDEDTCAGCGTCVQSCAAEAVELIDTVAVVNDDRCIGCGVCAHLCPESAINLEKTDMRRVFIPPPKLKTINS
ncbi:MAG: indolepyruvate ferredoxin oxidoreductase subunit alpha [Candidatus Heimdallarchaeota archaeon]